MVKLSEVSCEACRADARQLSEQEINEQLNQLPDWSVVEEDSTNKLRKAFKFKNFVEALDFTNSVGALAEEHNHHPDILTEWGKVTVTWWSHKIKGLHQLDFVLALKTSEL
jgi:4a-hydroxytetrahydrobiopterin dehydratase